MRARLFITSVWLAAVQGQEIIPLTQTVQFTSAAIATGASTATLVPFNVDLTAQPDYHNYDVVQKYSTSVWESRVAVYDDYDSESFLSFLSLLWPNGEGPGAGPVNVNKTWNGCIVAIPDLFDRVGATSRGDGSCFDVVDNGCLYNIMADASTLWETALRQETSLTRDTLARACRSVNDLLLVSSCFKSSTESSRIRAYPNLNPLNGQPFMFGVDKYKTKKENKADIQAKVLSRSWPLLILEAEQRDVVNAVMSCPSSGTGYFSDSFDSGNMGSWKAYGGAFDASSKALVGKSSGGGKAIINGINLSDFTYEADITFPVGSKSGNSGLVFRVSDPNNGVDSYRGYYAGLEFGIDGVVLGCANNNWKEIGRAKTGIRAGQVNHIKVRAEGDNISVYVDDMEKPKITVKDNTYLNGLAGVRVFYIDSTFDNISIKPLPPKDLAPSPDGTCGGPLRYKCTNSNIFYGNCCGANGFCGYSANECRDGCQSKYGLCDTVVTVTAKPTATATAKPTATASLPQPYYPYGCYTEGERGRALNGAVKSDSKMTYDLCANFCIKTQGSTLFGVEFGGECYCGNELTAGSVPVSSGCNMACSGDSTQTCGGNNRLNLFGKISKPYYPHGCYTEADGRRALNGAVVFDSAMTYDMCARFCITTRGYSLFGLEFGKECYCGNELIGSLPVLSGCTMACSGDSTQACGGSNRITLFGKSPRATSPSSTSYLGCFTEGKSSRALKDASTSDVTSMSAAFCANFCKRQGFGLFGTQFARECFCGNELQDGSVTAPESDCNMACTGNANESCGGSNRLSVYRLP